MLQPSPKVVTVSVASWGELVAIRLSPKRAQKKAWKGYDQWKNAAESMPKALLGWQSSDQSSKAFLPEHSEKAGEQQTGTSELYEYTLAKSEQLIHRFFMAIPISVRATSVSKCELTGTDTNQTIINRHHLSYNPHHRSTYLHPFGFQWLLAQSLRAIDGASSQYCVPWNQSLGDGLAVSVLSSTCRFFSKPEIPALHFLLQPLVDTLHCDALLPRRLLF